MSVLSSVQEGQVNMLNIYLIFKKNLKELHD